MMDKRTIAKMTMDEVKTAMDLPGLKSYELCLLANRFAKLEGVRLDDPYHGPKAYQGGGFSGK